MLHEDRDLVYRVQSMMGKSKVTIVAISAIVGTSLPNSPNNPRKNKTEIKIANVDVNELPDRKWMRWGAMDAARGLIAIWGEPGSQNPASSSNCSAMW